MYGIIVCEYNSAAIGVDDIYMERHTYVWVCRRVLYLQDTAVPALSGYGHMPLVLECKPDPSVFQVNQYLNWENHEKIAAGSPMSGLKLI